VSLAVCHSAFINLVDFHLMQNCHRLLQSVLLDLVLKGQRHSYAGADREVVSIAISI
jgi:hypothetical protein